MTSTKVRSAIAVAACAPLIAMGAGVASAAPAAEPAPAPVAPVPVEVQPAVLSPFITIPGAFLACGIVLITVPILFPVCVV
ncbi:hypothetical protein FEK35_16180 [Nocardia cyriacigeorgica]|uniref:Uncharacterized protein n=1 Tax=Nocardia cyriacigeorgica TaxID=135487 RepID=A0A5R8PCG5_9NOCA|nr:hypothetical protein [Nocardia cyriacigeorgica]TLG09048.1 hypothetical protein FEK35_16180 [Nocardia cyriacigeorgica]